MNDWRGNSLEESNAFLSKFGLKKFSKDTPSLLLNPKEDPRQSKNLYAEHPEKVKVMSALLKKYTDGQRCAPERK